MKSLDKRMTALEDFIRGASRLAVIGVGSKMRGDDAAGPKVIENLKELGTIKPGRLLLLEGGMTPEDSTKKLREFRPSHVLLIDAADFGGKPGEIALFSREDIRGVSISTHSMPLSMLLEYIEREFGVRTLMVGIQPGKLRLGEGMSAGVKRAVMELAERMKGLVT